MKIYNTLATVSNSLKACESCPSAKHCIAGNLNESELGRFSNLVKHRRIIHRGENVFSAGDDFRSLFIVRSGSVKSYVDSADGEQQIIGFHFAGDLLGADGIENKRHASSLTALETTSVCEVEFRLYEELAQQIPKLLQQVLRFMSREIARENSKMLSLGRMSGERRLAEFLVGISESMDAHALSANSFNLSMTRHEIANYLGMAGETVSRLLHRLQDLGVISVMRERIEINDHIGLNNIADNCTDDLYLSRRG